MTTMIEKIARAIENTRRPCERGNELSKTIGDFLTRLNENGYLHDGELELLLPTIARAVVEAMRQITKEMSDAGYTAAQDVMEHDYSSDIDGNRHDYSYLSPNAQATIYHAMIDAILNEKQP